MPWIKKNPHLLTLILVALGVVGASAMLVMNTQSFDRKFEVARQQPTKGTNVYKQAQDDVEKAAVEFQKPATWSLPILHFSPFVSERYRVTSADPTKLELVGTGASNTDTLTKQPIPDTWPMANKLQPFKTGVMREDPDGDGFWNEDEWRGKTDPNDPKSHPPYYTKLFIKRFIKVPFLLKFQVYDGDPKKLDDMSFQINTLSLRQPSVFLKIGEMVPKTHFKIKGFEFKNEVSGNGTELDLSELTIVDIDTNAELKLILNKVIDSPDSYALFAYLHPSPPKDIQVKKLQQFALLPDKDQLYKLLDVSEDQALIQTPSGEKVQIPRLPAGYPQ